MKTKSDIPGFSELNELNGLLNPFVSPKETYAHTGIPSDEMNLSLMNMFER